MSLSTHKRSLTLQPALCPQTACIEALDAGDRGTAKQALLLLLERAAAAPPIAEGSGAGEGGGASGAAGAGAGYEATIFQNLIRLVLVRGAVVLSLVH